MKEQPKIHTVMALPEFLRVCVEKGIVDEITAQRIELHRRTKGLGSYQSHSAFMNDPPDPDPNLTFDNFAMCRGTSFATELAKTVAYKSPSTLPYNPLYMYGPTGLGKTHLLSAIAFAARNRKVLLVNTGVLEAEVENARRQNVRAALRQWLVSAEILLVDDIQLCEDNEHLQRDLFSVLNHMTKAHRWVVITSDVPPTRLAGVESRLLSRLGGGVIVSLQMGNKAERRKVVKHFVGNQFIPESVIDYLAEHIYDNVRQLKEAVAQLIALSESAGTSVSMDMARALVATDHEQARLAADSIALPPERGLQETEALKRPDTAVAHFKEMLACAASEEEQALALQIALGQRIKQLRDDGVDAESLNRLEQATDLLREGKTQEAIQCIGS